MITIEQMNEALQARLKRLGVVKGTRNLRSPGPARPGRAPVAPLEQLFPGGSAAETAEGSCFVVDRVYPLDTTHGSDRLADLPAIELTPAVPYARDDRLSGRNLRDFVFLDTETTGLAGAGTLAFMVGVGYLEQRARPDGGTAEVFVARQYFLRDPGDEGPMLTLLDDLLAHKSGLVTFNGRSFDLPLLDTRYLMNRRAGRVLDLPHVDLLPLSRRMYRARVGSCALGSLEQSILGVRRSGEDVPGWLIPTLYSNYLRSGDVQPLAGVFYHNRLDLLSMVTLATRLVNEIHQPEQIRDPLDRLSMAKWQIDVGHAAAAEATLRALLTTDLELEPYQEALWRLALLYKQTDRRAEAVPLWQQLAVISMDSVDAHVELAKFYEWHEPDLAAAVRWTEQALALVERRRPSSALFLKRGELNQRLARLRHKLGASGSDLSA
jgi:uncharacterized protein YprB with RNaseH-like and TPR domain